MGGIGRKTEPPKAEDAAAKKPAPLKRPDDDDYEDGDFVSPKLDRSDNDDEPL